MIKLIVSSVFVFLACTSDPFSPNCARSVYILCLRDPNDPPEVVTPLGTAFAIDTPSQSIAMTCTHCIWIWNAEKHREERRLGELLLVKKILRDYHTPNRCVLSTTDSDDEVFYVTPIFHTYESSSDICLLQIISTDTRNV